MEYSFNIVLNTTIASTKTVANIEVNKKHRNKLYRGETNLSLANNQTTKFFVHDLKTEGIKNPTIHPIPDGDTTFIFCKIKGKTRYVQVFLDTGCDTVIVK